MRTPPTRRIEAMRRRGLSITQGMVSRRLSHDASLRAALSRVRDAQADLARHLSRCRTTGSRRTGTP